MFFGARGIFGLVVVQLCWGTSVPGVLGMEKIDLYKKVLYRKAEVDIVYAHASH